MYQSKRGEGCFSKITKQSNHFQVMRADYLTGRTALHFAAVNGHVRCIRLVVADFVPSAPHEAVQGCTDADRSDGSNVKSKHDQRYPFSFQM